ncbi:complement C5-like [Perognathus longimembris pacificus]|uniref:complement C5-like n=1 Tax=Perognathus longimembris pacificus TaxID=214514 RepID=UPI0020197B52|nr:complement C5-like [Perognathus longimembris pacificus]
MRPSAMSPLGILLFLIFLEKSGGQEQIYSIQKIQDQYKVDFPTISTTQLEIKDDSSNQIIRTRRDLKQRVDEQAAKYRHPMPKKCCYDGARLSIGETCAQRAARITIGPHCTRAFNECCTITNNFKHKYIHFGMEKTYEQYYRNLDLRPSKNLLPSHCVNVNDS